MKVSDSDRTSTKVRIGCFDEFFYAHVMRSQQGTDNKKVISNKEQFRKKYLEKSILEKKYLLLHLSKYFLKVF